MSRQNTPKLHCIVLLALAGCSASPLQEQPAEVESDRVAPASIAAAPTPSARDELAQTAAAEQLPQTPPPTPTTVERRPAATDEAAPAAEPFAPAPVSEASRADSSSTVFRPARLACTRKACRADPCCNRCQGEWRSEGFGLKLEGEAVPQAVTDSCGRREFDIRAVGRRVGARFIAERWWKIAAGKPHEVGTNAGGPDVTPPERPAVAIGQERIVAGDPGFALAPVHSLLGRRVSALRQCLAGVLKAQPDATLGDATLRFTVKPSGAVTVESVSGTAHERAKSCVRNVARRLRLRAGPAQPVSVEVEVRFARPGEAAATP